MGRRRLSFVFWFLCSSASVEAQLTPAHVYSTRVNGEQIFVVEVSNPAPASTVLDPIRPAQAIRPTLPRLVANDPWSVQAFVEYEPADYGMPTVNNSMISFVGKTNLPGPLSLRLEYFDTSSTWKSQTINVNLAGAKEVPLVDAPNPTPVPSWEAPTPTPRGKLKSKPSPAPRRLSASERLALAKANWFHYLRSIYGDFGGFYTFGEYQTKRASGLPTHDRGGSLPSGVWNGEDPAIRLYETTTGAFSLQEALQLDRMQAQNRTKEPRTIDVSTLTGIAVKSLPFDQMRAGKEPTEEPLAAFIPRDNYFLGFRDVGKMLSFFDFLDDWGTQFLNFFEPSAVDFGARDKLHEQLCLPNSALSKIFGPAIIGGAAITGSDPYLREGSDVSVLFQVTQKEVFTPAVQVSFDAARTTNPDAVYSTEETPQGRIESLQNPDRRISCHRMWQENVMIYSNSKTALKRILNARAHTEASLASASDFKYARAVIYPFDPANEDGLLYLSDDFLRNVSSPQMRIKEKRRLEAFTSLRMISNANLLEGFDRGKGSRTLDELVADKKIAKADLDLGYGDTVAWDPERQRASSSVYGSSSFMTPLIELPIDKVTAGEKTSYETFRQGYEYYWRRYFDPVAIRIRNTKDVSFDVTILPLIDDSGYQSFRDVTGGNVVTLRVNEIPDTTLFRFLFHLNPASHEVQSFKQFAGGMLGSAQPIPQMPGQPGRAPGSAQAPVLDWIGEWITFWIEDSDAFTKLMKHDYERRDGAPLTNNTEFSDLFDIGVVLGINAKNPLSVAGFLVGLRSMIQTTAPGLVLFKDLPPYKNITIVQIAPDPHGEWYRELLAGRPVYDAMAQPTPTPTEAIMKAMESKGIFYAVIRDGLYFSTKASALQNLIDQVDSAASLGGIEKGGSGVSGNTLVYLSSGNKKALGSARYYVEQASRDACIANLGAVYALGRAGIFSGPLKDGAEAPFLGYRVVCPSGGGYSYDPSSDTASSDTYGSPGAFKRREDLTPDSRAAHLVDSVQRLISGLSFTPHGLTASLKIERRP